MTAGRVIKRGEYLEGSLERELEPSAPLHPKQEELLEACRAVGHGLILVEVADGLPQVKTRVKYLEKPRPITG